MKIKRVVKLHFKLEAIEPFKAVFDESKRKIRAFDGCTHLELWQAADNPQIFFTYSFWDSEDALNAYRHSDFFRKTWSKTKVLFAEKPQAWSVVVLDETDNQ